MNIAHDEWRRLSSNVAIDFDIAEKMDRKCISFETFVFEPRAQKEKSFQIDKATQNQFDIWKTKAPVM